MTIGTCAHPPSQRPSAAHGLARRHGTVDADRARRALTVVAPAMLLLLAQVQIVKDGHPCGRPLNQRGGLSSMCARASNRPTLRWATANTAVVGRPCAVTGPAAV